MVTAQLIFGWSRRTRNDWRHSDGTDFIYAAFPISQFIRSTGDKLSSSTNSIIPFLFKDVLEAGLKLLGYSAALIALASAAAGLVSFIVDTDVFAYGYQGLNSMGPDSMEMGLSGLAGFIEMEIG